MWAKIFAALVVAVAVTGIGVFYAAPGAVADLAFSDGDSADGHTCCSAKKAATCPVGGVETGCSATEQVSASVPQAIDAEAAAKIGAKTCPTDAFAACSGGLTLAASRTRFNCCAE